MSGPFGSGALAYLEEDRLLLSVGLRQSGR
jgi:hypothetical protein